MSGTTSHYNVYRVLLSQRSGTDHEGLALVPAQMPEQEAGRFYHVVGNVGLGMDYQMRGRYNFERSKSFKCKHYLYQIKRESLQDWEDICKSKPAPHDPRVLTERTPDPPAPDCTTWVKEVIQEAQTLAV